MQDIGKIVSIVVAFVSTNLLLMALFFDDLFSYDEASCHWNRFSRGLGSTAVLTEFEQMADGLGKEEATAGYLWLIFSIISATTGLLGIIMSIIGLWGSVILYVSAAVLAALAFAGSFFPGTGRCGEFEDEGCNFCADSAHLGVSNVMVMVVIFAFFIAAALDFWWLRANQVSGRAIGDLTAGTPRSSRRESTKRQSRSAYDHQWKEEEAEDDSHYVDDLRSDEIRVYRDGDEVRVHV